MRTVSEAFKQEQRRESNIIIRTVQYKRRYWDQATNTYIWESSWTDVSESWISTISPINWQLDSERLNEFKVSNVAILLNNADGRFFFTNPFGFFGPDSASGNGYEPYWTKFRVRVGHLLPDDTEELVTIFTGVATEFTWESMQRTCQVTVQGLEATLINANAEDMATDISLENAGTGDGSDTEFTTLNPGVGGVTLVSVAGITQIEGEDYTLSQLNDATLGAKVTFTDPPDLGEVILITYFYWPQDVQFHEAVELLLDAAGVDASNQQVEPVAFSNSVLVSQNYTSTVDWDSGTKTNIDTVTEAGNLKIDFADDDFKVDDNWLDSLSGWTQFTSSGGSWGTTGGVQVDHTIGGAGVSRRGYIYRAQTHYAGVFQLDFKFDATSSQTIKFSFSGQSAGLVDSDYLDISISPALGTLSFPSSGGGSATWTPDTNWHTIKVVRYGDGTIKVYLDGTLKITNTSPVTTSSVFVYIEHGSSAGGQTAHFRNLYRPIATLTAEWVSPAIDLGATPTAWGTFDHEETEDGATITYETRSSTDGISWDAYVEISGANVPQSALKRYVQIRTSFSMSSDNNQDPFTQEVTISAATSSSAITLPAFTGMTVYEAIQAIGVFTNYEFGFDADENFFFRPKTVSSSVIDLEEGNFVINITGMTTGYERVFGGVRATYGDIVRLITDDALFRESPKARVSSKIFDIQADSNIQISPSADIATGIAQGLFAELKRPRRRAKINVKFLPQFELSDVVTIRAIQATPAKRWWMGDNDVNMGDLDVFLHGEGEQIAFGMQAKIIGIRYDSQQARTELDVEEIAA